MRNNSKSSIFSTCKHSKMELPEIRDNISSLFSSITTLPQKSTLTFCFNDKKHTITGRHAQTLYWLLRHRSEGITPISVCNTAWRLANYVFYLRKHCGLDIKTDKEPHSGGYHARYTLLSDITIIQIVYDNKRIYFSNRRGLIANLGGLHNVWQNKH